MREKKKTNYFGLHLTEVQRNYIQRKADEDDRSVAGYVRKLIDEDMKKAGK